MRTANELKWFMFVITAFLVGCASTLPSKNIVTKSYSLIGVKTYSINLTCNRAEVTNLDRSFLEGYCQALEGSTKMTLRKKLPEIRYEKENPDLIIKGDLERIHGGSGAARFWIGFGAGRSITTLYVKIYKGQDLMAERRITETTTLMNLMSGNYSNEDAIIQDAPLVARKVADFISDPLKNTDITDE